MVDLFRMRALQKNFKHVLTQRVWMNVHALNKCDINILIVGLSRHLLK